MPLINVQIAESYAVVITTMWANGSVALTVWHRLRHTKRKRWGEMMTPEERFEKNRKLVPFVFKKYFIAHQEHIEDLFSEGYLSLWKACSTYDESFGISFCTYGCSQVFFSMKNYLNRQVNSHNDISLDEIQAEDKEGNSICLYDMLCVYDYNPTKDLLDACLKKMKERDKSIIRFLLYGLNQKETAAKMGLSQGTVSRCLAQFKQLVEEERKL